MCVVDRMGLCSLPGMCVDDCMGLPGGGGGACICVDDCMGCAGFHSC